LEFAAIGKKGIFDHFLTQNGQKFGFTESDRIRNKPLIEKVKVLI
jgi:hypothetical protein